MKCRTKRVQLKLLTFAQQTRFGGGRVGYFTPCLCLFVKSLSLIGSLDSARGSQYIEYHVYDSTRYDDRKEMNSTYNVQCSFLHLKRC